MAPPPPAGIGPLLLHPYASLGPPPLPGTPVLNLISTSGFTLGTSWIDQVSAQVFTQINTGPIVAGTINGIFAPDLSIGGNGQWSGPTISTILNATSFTIAVVAKYTGSAINSGVDYTDPVVFGDASGYVGTHMMLDPTDNTAIRVSVSVYPGAATVAGPTGSATIAHLFVAQLTGGLLSVALDGGTPASASSSGVESLSAASRVGGGIGQFDGPIARVVAWGPGTQPSMSDVYDALQPVYGTP